MTHSTKTYDKKTATARITIFILGSILIFAILISAFSFVMYRNSTIGAYSNRVYEVSATAASLIDAARFEESISGGEPDEYWAIIDAQFQEIYSRLGDLAYLYIIVPYRDELFNYYVSTALPGEFMVLEEASVELYGAEAADAFREGRTFVSEMEDAGEWGILMSSFSPIFGSSGEVIAAVGADIFADRVAQNTNRFSLIMAIYTLTGSAIIGFLIYMLLSKLFRPIKILAGRMEKTSNEGYIVWSEEEKSEISRYTSRKDVVGDLMVSYENLTSFLLEICDELTLVSDGKFDSEITIRSQKDDIFLALRKTAGSLSEMLKEINLAAGEVSAASGQIAEDSNSLAKGSYEQSASVEELSAAVSQIDSQTKSNAEMAKKAAALSKDIKSIAEKGNGQMNEMIAAVSEINQSGRNISKVIKSIDDIAFQTNILALNASVEAARAGAHGKGFAVVAEEVRSLAAKSAEAAKDTESLIQDSIAKAERGSQIAGNTAASLNEIVSGIAESTQLISEIASSSEQQSTGIAQINAGIEKVAQVTQTSSTTAQQSAASSQQMSNQADMLGQLVSRFKLKGAYLLTDGDTKNI